MLKRCLVNAIAILFFYIDIGYKRIIVLRVSFRANGKHSVYITKTSVVLIFVKPEINQKMSIFEYIFETFGFAWNVW